MRFHDEWGFLNGPPEGVQREFQPSRSDEG